MGGGEVREEAMKKLHIDIPPPPTRSSLNRVVAPNRPGAMAVAGLERGGKLWASVIHALKKIGGAALKTRELESDMYVLFLR